MNAKLILFSGIVTAMIGSVIGLGSAHLGQPDFNHLKYEGESYHNL